MMFHSRLLPAWQMVTLAVVAGLLLAGGAALYLDRPNSSSSSPPMAGFGQSISLNGHIVCLPHRDKTGPQTEECAYGLQGDDKYYYGLLGLDQSQLIDGTVSPQKYVSVVGTLQQPAANDKYDIYGNINISTISVH
jgi:hypothetical protein